MRRKRRNRGTWLPLLGSAGLGGLPENSSSCTFITGTVPADGSVDIFTTPLLLDTPQETLSAGVNQATPMAFLIGNEYILKRIVGKLHIGVQQFVEDDGDPSFLHGALFTAGFFVARADDGDPDQAIGQNSSIIDTILAYGPENPDVIREPWIWRRSWALSNRAGIEDAATQSTEGFKSFPTSNAFYGSMADGPHIDARTLRRVTNDDRLFFALQFHSLGGAKNTGIGFNAVLDIRAFGALRRARQQGRF